MSFVREPVDHFIDKMAQRKLPSPAAGSSLALSFAMACALIELTLADLAEKEMISAPLNPKEDLKRVRKWREEGKKLIDDDINAVELMIRKEEQVSSSTLLMPVWRLHQLAEKLEELLIQYLGVNNEKISDTLVAMLHVRTVFLGTIHILGFNCFQMGVERPFSKEWSFPLVKWDQCIHHTFQQLDL